MTGDGRHCPVAKAAEIFDQRWTLLVMPSWFTLGLFSPFLRPADHGTG